MIDIGPRANTHVVEGETIESAPQLDTLKV